MFIIYSDTGQISCCCWW